MLEGAVYCPNETDPRAGETLHVTAVLLVPLTVDMNCVIWFADRETEAGANVIETEVGGAELG